mmetsp:Transcript_26758/g.53539  ORF Transcript_26758/g.53539 Transcript_26758/m.53539 type:complete len:92 (-) Transcript_26758:204-479(-)
MKVEQVKTKLKFAAFVTVEDTTMGSDGSTHRDEKLHHPGQCGGCGRYAQEDAHWTYQTIAYACTGVGNRTRIFSYEAIIASTCSTPCLAAP